MTLTYEEQDYVIVATDENGKQYFIPKDEGNSDYQRYLNPEAEQSTPIVIDEAEVK
jgi:hypothetical protein